MKVIDFKERRYFCKDLKTSRKMALSSQERGFFQNEVTEKDAEK